MFRRAPSRGGRGGGAAVDFVTCFGWGGFFVFLCWSGEGVLIYFSASNEAVFA